MSDPREKNAEIVRAVVANADLDGLDAFMTQYARSAVIEWLFDQMPVEARVHFLNTLVVKYAHELADAPSPPS